MHDAANGYGGFGSFIFNADPSNQLRLMTSLRRDYYQIPYDPFPNDIENADIPENDFYRAISPASDLRDSDHESDALVNVSWVHTFNSKALMTISPFYHYNAANYASPLTDFPVAATQERSSNYAGGQASFNANVGRNNFQAGVYSFYQTNRESFGAVFNDGSGNPPFTDLEHQPAVSRPFSSTTSSSRFPG